RWAGTALWGGWVGETLALAHRYAGLGAGALLALHLALAARRPGGRGAVAEALSGAGAGGAAAAVAVAALALAAPTLTPLPRADRAGQALSTAGRFFDRPPPASRSCGTAGCHEQLYTEWREGPHGQADRDPYYRALQSRLVGGKAAPRIGLCLECHDPSLLVTGQFEPGAVPVQTGEAVSCYACHAMARADGKRERANYAVAPPPGGAGEDSVLGRFLVRAWPGSHRRRYGRALYERSALCSACHRATVNEEIPGFGTLRIENPFQRWELARVKPLCQDCHMAARKSETYPSQRSHRFEASAVPPGVGAEQRSAVERMLSGNSGVPDIRGGSSTDPLFALSASGLSGTTGAGELHVTLTDLGRIGHQFPAGAVDLQRVWLEAQLTDSSGAELARWGEVEPGGALLPGTPVFRRLGVVAAGELEGSPFGWLRPEESVRLRLTLPATLHQGRLAGSRLQGSLCYRKLHGAAIRRLDPDGGGLGLPPRQVIGRLDEVLGRGRWKIEGERRRGRDGGG
ncbi:MAG: hypothetical protein HYY25_00175, partial [Candidatus Wallbacteria bacterium]|nr:hypothetical protein [Candidatus Wallbacteria bacterium]